MEDEIKALISAKCKDFPKVIQQYLHAVLDKIIGIKLREYTSFEQVNLILGSIDFTCEEAGDEAYILGIKYNQSANREDSFPIWKIIWSEKTVTQESKRIYEIMEWIFERNVLLELKAASPRYYSRCQEKKVVFTELNGQIISIPVRDIIYLSAEGDFTRVFHGHKTELKSNLVDLSMRGAERLMKPFCFHRIHRSYMVNLGCIRKIETFSTLSRVVLCSGIELPIARRRKVSLQEMYQQLT